MNTTFRLIRALALLISALLVATAAADVIVPPPRMNYQGRVMQNGVNFNGTGQFKFMLINRTSSGGSEQVVWKNDGSLTAAEPVVAVSLTVTDGHFSVALGETTLAGMEAALPAGAFGPLPGLSDLSTLLLRIWFRPGTTGPFVRFSPDVSIQSVPFAFSAMSVGGVPADEVITQGDPLRITRTQPGVQQQSSMTQSVTAQHGVAGMTFMRNPIRVKKTFANDWKIAVLSATDAAVSLFNFTDSPDTLTRGAVVRDGVGGFNRLAGPTDMCVRGRRIYVTSGAENALTIFDFDGATNAVTLRTELVDGTGAFTRLDSPSAVVAWTSDDSREIAAVASAGQGAILIMDVSSTTPTLLSTIDTAALNLTGFSAPSALKVVARSVGGLTNTVNDTLYAACPLTNAIFAFDVTNPSIPVLHWTRTNANTGFSSMTGPSRFAEPEFSNTTPALVVVCPAGNSVGLVNPDTGAAFSFIVNGSSGFSRMLSPQGAFLRESDSAQLAIASSGSNALSIADISDLRNPRLVQVLEDGVGGFSLLGGCHDVASQFPQNGGATRLFIAGRTDNAITVTTAESGRRFLSLTTTRDIGAGTGRPHTRIEAYESGKCAIRVATSSSGDASLQLLEYDPTAEELPFGYEWRYDGVTDVLHLNAIGFAGNTGSKASFTKSGNMSLQGTLTQGSDRDRKENIVPVDPATVLEKVAALPVSEWSYIGEDGVRHLGPMSQDFRAAFSLGATEKGIASVDADGVALASIKALKAEMDALKRENSALRERVERMEAVRGK